MIGPKHVHLERINGSTYRLSVFVDIAGLKEFLGWLRGHGVMLCESILEHGHTKTKTTELDQKEF
jgi:hypothetical protein